MIRILFALVLVAVALLAEQARAMTATCSGRYQRASLYFEAHGSLLHKRDGRGFVRINNRVVAEFDGDAAHINYLRKTFSIRNDRGDVVEGRLNSVSTGASTLTSMVLPGEGIRVANVPVNCNVR